MRRLFSVLLIFLGLSFSCGAHAATVTESITFAINADYAAQHPDWQEKAQEIITDVNKIFAKTTGLRYEIGAFRTYPAQDFSSVQAGSSYYAMVHLDQYSLGTTVFYLAPTNDEAENVLQASGWEVADMQSQPFFGIGEDGSPFVRYSITVRSSMRKDFLSQRIILGKEALAASDPAGARTYQFKVNGLAHEFGHTFGLGIPEYYIMQDGSDMSGVAPFLQPFTFQKAYGDDVMNSLSPDPIEGSFNKMSSYIIDQNSRHQFTVNDNRYYTKKMSSVVKVRVKAADGLPVQGAQVRVYGSKTNCRYCNHDPTQNNLPAPLLETLTTDAGGTATLQGLTNENLGTDLGTDPTHQAWVIKVVKVYDGPRTWAGYVTTYDLLRAKTLRNEDVYVMEADFQASGQIGASPAPAATPPTGGLADPKDFSSLQSTIGAIRNVSAENLVSVQVGQDAKAFGLVLTEGQALGIRNFIVYGISALTVKLGQGERRALMRDYMETVHRGDVIWTDVERLTNGQIPLVRNLGIERQKVRSVLPIFQRIFGHAPNFKDMRENLAWNTLLYRIRFTRDLIRESSGIKAYRTMFTQYPATPLDWATVRVLGYIR